MSERPTNPSSPASLHPALRRALLAARSKREERGPGGDGTIVLSDLEVEEALALDSLLTPRQSPQPKAELRVPLSRFEEALRSAGFDPRAAYEHVCQAPLRDIPAERDANRRLRTGFRTWLRSHEVVSSRPALAEWCEDGLRQGRLREDIRPLVEQALEIVAVLPAPASTQRTVLAAKIADDPHALDVGSPLHSLVTSMLASLLDIEATSPALDKAGSTNAGSAHEFRASTPRAGATATAISPREIWSSFNVLVDPISSNVAALNLPLEGDVAIVTQLRATQGRHVVLTYGQLGSGRLRWREGAPCFSCENPSVLIAAEQALGEECPPLLCTAGHPSDAVRLLFSAAHKSGAHIRHHGDFDAAGVQILRDLESRYDARPWRFDLESLSAALKALGRTPPQPRRQTLESAVEMLHTPLSEELVIDELLADLRRA